MAINVSTGLPDLFTGLPTYYALVYRLNRCLLTYLLCACLPTYYVLVTRGKRHSLRVYCAITSRLLSLLIGSDYKHGIVQELRRAKEGLVR